MIANARPWLLLALAWPAPALAGKADSDADATLAGRAVGILRQYCYRCHGQQFKVEGYNVLDRGALVAARGEGELPYITPSKPDDSELWARIDEMPPKGPRPSDDEKDTLMRWIEAGAPFPEAAPRREFVSDAAVLAAIRDDLRTLDSADRPSRRYFTLTALHNNPKVTGDELRLARAGVSKMINSLSRKPTIVVPEILGPGGTVLAVDLRRLGWDNRRVWSLILAEYPYGLKFKNHQDREIREAAEEVERLVGEDAGIPDVRADWFLDSAGRPGLYHAILDIPKTVGELERSLHVDVEADFRDNTLRRAGFNKSGVSKQMRLVDRHDSDLGYYWRSYDFRKSGASVNLFRSPLGPAFEGNPFPDQAFTHAGGEIIFSLPNRLQGYMLVDAEGNRIEEGPTDIVFDSNDAAGTSTIVNGLSCLACHANGMKGFKDQVREAAAVSDAPRRKVERLFAPHTEMDRVLAQDEAQFLGALDKAIGPFLDEGGDATQATARDREPIVPIARHFQADLDAGTVAAELNLKDASTLQGLIRANPRLQRLGLAALLEDDGAINRAEWATAGKGTSTYQRVSSELDRGTPAVFYRLED